MLMFGHVLYMDGHNTLVLWICLYMDGHNALMCGAVLNVDGHNALICGYALNMDGHNALVLWIWLVRRWTKYAYVYDMTNATSLRCNDSFIIIIHDINQSIVSSSFNSIKGVNLLISISPRSFVELSNYVFVFITIG